MSSKIKISQTDGLKPVKKEAALRIQKLVLNKNIRQIPGDSGIFGTSPATIDTLYKKAENEKVISNNGAYIVLGSDRPDSVASGYGGKGSNRAATIDLVVGRMASAHQGRGPKEGTLVDNSFFADAARIYISEMTDIDKNFDIDTGDEPAVKGHSGIGMKADAIRIIGREGVKIVTGKANNARFGFGGETNSKGGKISQPSPRIEFIAGNRVEKERLFGKDVSLLQPVCLGYNTRDAIEELSEIVSEVASAVYSLSQAVNRGFVASSTAFGASVDPVNVAASATISAQNFKIISDVQFPIWITRINNTLFGLNYLMAGGRKFIGSRSVYTT